MTTIPISPPPPHEPPNERPGEGQPTKTKRDAGHYALLAAGVGIVILTACAFWLSYAHLAEVAGQHGLAGSPLRRWAWPATLDAFIVVGELLMLHASLRRVTDRWAIALTAVGSVGSIALNVFGAGGTRDLGDVPLLDYVVAAVPPTAALLAFGALMRHIHRLVDRTDSNSDQADETSVQGPAPATASPDSGDLPLAAAAERTELLPQDAGSKARGGRPPKATIKELADIGRSAAHQHGKLTRGLLRKAVKERNLTLGSERQTEVMDLLRPELEAAGIEVSKR
ncbi:DUF2637 domain-containing protein [Streptomyces albidoflavus]